MCCLKKIGLIWLLIHYYYGGDAPPHRAPGRADARTDIALGTAARLLLHGAQLADHGLDVHAARGGGGADVRPGGGVHRRECVGPGRHGAPGWPCCA